MRFSTILANVALASAAVVPVQKRVTESASLFATDLGISDALNAESKTDTAWIGTDGDYTGEFINTSGEDIEVIIWGPDASWVNVDAPLITYALTNGSNVTISFAEGLSGAFSALYNWTELVDGQVSNTWGEFTFSGDYSTFDVSREVNMLGSNFSIVAEDSCVSDMSTCVFQCLSGVSCWETYELKNCTGQIGSESGTFDGADSGGCLVGSTNKITTTFY